MVTIFCDGVEYEVAHDYSEAEYLIAEYIKLDEAMGFTSVYTIL